MNTSHPFKSHAEAARACQAAFKRHCKNFDTMALAHKLEKLYTHQEVEPLTSEEIMVLSIAYTTALNLVNSLDEVPPVPVQPHPQQGAGNRVGAIGKVS